MMPPSTAEIPCLATAEAIKNMGGDHELYAQVVQIFLDDAVEQRATLDSALAAGDWVTAHRVAHTIKGTSASLGAERLYQCALVLEKACAAGDPGAIARLAPALRAELEASSIALREYLHALG